MDTSSDELDSLMKTPVTAVDIDVLASFRSGLEAALSGELTAAPGNVRAAIRSKMNLICSQLMLGTPASDPELMNDANLLHRKLGEVRGGALHQQKLMQLVPVIE